ncbi:MAG: GDP-mannose 4,6-dehydratase [Anaerolineae bacterium]|nr:GDP-mannose 4,6-dehydratase [Anaerolineae bacterium]
MDYAGAFSGKRVLITGGLGFIGSHLAHRLVNLGAEVLLVDSLIPDYGGNLFNITEIERRVRVNIADVRDTHGMNYLVQHQDYLFNLAGQVSHLDSMVDPVTDLEINCRSQISILEACRQFNPEVKIVFASTRQIYGKPQYLPVDEKHPLAPTDINGVNKVAGEWYHMVYHRVYGLRTVSLRMTNTYGPHMRVKDARQTFIGWWIHQIVDNKALQIFGDGRQIRDFNYVSDVVEALLLAGVAPQAEGEIYNLGSSEPVSLLELAEMLREINPEAEPFEIVPFPPEKKRIDIGDYCGDFSKMTAQLGWNPEVSLREGLMRTVAFYRANKAHYW